MRPSSSTSEPDRGLFGALAGGSAVDTEVGDRAWLRALLDAERALALASAKAGVVPAEAAEAIAGVCERLDLDPGDLGRRALASGNPVVPLIEDLSGAVGGTAGRWVHHGATSQDIMDTAASLVAWRALGPLLADLGVAAGAAARLAGEHRGTVMAARTLGQQALPTTFGLKAAGWLAGLDQAAAGLARVRAERLAVQLGGAAGTLAGFGAAGPAVAAAMAAELGLAEPLLPWHTERTRVAELAGALGAAAGVMGKIALDVGLLAQTEVGEVGEPAAERAGERSEAVHGKPPEARGGSSTLPHKRNPVLSVLVGAAARRAPGLVATLLAAMPQEHERAAGAWHAEWVPLTELLALTGGAAARVAELLGGLQVDPGRMRANLDATGGLLMTEAVAAKLADALGRLEAKALVGRLARRAAEAGAPLRDVLLATPDVTDHLDEAAIDAALDPAGWLGASAELIDRALAAHQHR